MSLVQYSWCPYKRGNLGTDIDTPQGECHVKMKAEVGVVLLQTKGYQRLPADTRSLG